MKLSKAAKGLTHSDVSNAAIRSILAYISIEKYGRFTENDMIETLDFFEWRCPYTGIDLREKIINKTGGYATDHIIPQNMTYCGLNIKGNLIIVDKTANNIKGKKTAKEFLLDDSLPFWSGTPRGIRQSRLNRIHEFQSACGYRPEAIRQAICPLLQQIYSDVQDEQRRKIKMVLHLMP